MLLKQTIAVWMVIKIQWDGVKPGLLLIFSDISTPTVEFSVMSHLIKMITQDQELIIFYALQILFFSNLTYLPITTKLLDHKGVLLVPAKKSPQNLTFLDPSLLTISGLNQAVCLETLATFWDYLMPTFVSIYSIQNPLSKIFFIFVDSCQYLSVFFPF